MIAGKPSTDETRLAVDLSSAGVARLALVAPGGPVSGEITSYKDAEFSTMTAVFQKFGRDRGISLACARAAIAIAGVPTGAAIPIVRSRWTLSRDGLNRYFGRPVIIVNEVAAKAWSVFGATGHEVRPLSEVGALSLARSGRWAFVSLADGVGIAVIDTTGGDRRVLETEAGHVGMTSFDDCGETIIGELRRRGLFCSWENGLKLALGAERKMLPEYAAQRCLGAWAADLIYSYSAWDGIVFCDRAAEILASPPERAAFLAQPKVKRPYDRLLAQVPSWSLVSRNAALRGCAIMLDQW